MFFTYQNEFNDQGFRWEGEEGVKLYTADFETTTKLEDCRVWAFAICDVDDIDHMIYGNSIEGFFKVCAALPDCRMYFHNLAFDISFMFDYMLKNGYVWEDGRFPRRTRGFTTVISDMNQVYACRVNFGNGHNVTFWDSMKIIPLSIKQEAKAFGLTMEKGELDYHAERPMGHELTEDEIDYIRRDVQIDAQAIRFTIDNGMKSMTIGSCALGDYRAMMGGRRGFRHHFPEIDRDADTFMRRAYRGGWVYVNPKYAGEVMGEGISFDVNSLYPSVMASCAGEVLPYGTPKWFYGEPRPTSKRPLWIAQVRLSFRSKPSHLPCIQMKGNLHFLPTEYVTDSNGEVTITITSVDWNLILRQYDVEVYEWIGGYSFKGSTELFKAYVDKWVRVKNDATIQGNEGMRTIAKLMLNSLYGKFATQMSVRSRRPEIRDGVVRYVDLPEQERESVYLPVGCFITAWARFKTITTAQACGDRFVYSDTDSVKVIGLGHPDIDVDPVRLGAWKDEGHFTRFKALRAKTYIAEYPKGIEVHVAGLPYQCHSQVTFGNFELGAIYTGKKYQTRVDGGIVLVDGDFQIKG